MGKSRSVVGKWWMSLTEAQPWNVCYRFELAQQAPKALLEVGFLARHPGARNWGWGGGKTGNVSFNSPVRTDSS